MTEAYELGLDTKTLYQCRNCSTVAAVKMGGCPNCEHSEGRTVERGSLTGGSVEKQLPWYKTVEVVTNG